MENKPSVSQLYPKFLRNTISEAEYNQLLYHFGTDLSAEELKHMILLALETEVDDEISPIYSTQINDTVKLVKGKLFADMQVLPVRRANIWRQFLPYAAAVFILLTGVVSYRFLYSPVSPQSIAGLNVPPGNNKALLKLQSGEEIVLSEQQEGIISHGDEIKYADGTSVKSETGVQMISLSTPVSGQYQVQLPDGTKAWLNSLSSISYPTSFTGNQRKITISGEVYLEVAKDATKKFIVAAKDQQIEVLGTSFNVNAYEDDGGVYTTLAEGSLQVTGLSGGGMARLKPGQQAVLVKGENITVRQTDVSEVTSWKDGFYLLKNQPLSLFSKQLERWYNVEIDMGDKGDLRLSALIPRDIQLFEVLQAIELKTGIKFKVEGRRIMVK